ncbi:MAG TPA: insulinase family protein, partial [Deinococcales bacterium]|nr:insulinase family protein [Deinococcales bacterium]
MAQPEPATPDFTADRYPVGTRLGRHVVTRSEPLTAIGARYYELTHEPTGARHVHIASGDDNNAFAVAFPTIPDDSTGVAHILEHISLCGSKRYPVRDPFFSMLPRSLNTFMNAFTAYDWTAYPISTRNAKDYRNLVDVYLDCTFFPRLLEMSFKQEGHRLEFETPDDPTSPLEIKGVVYNEMKGAMADPRAIMGRAVGRVLFPDLTYANNRGGDPRDIPNLTWEQLRAFHARHYHPSNALFYTYGNLPLEGTLELIEQQALRHFERLDVNFSIPDQKPFAAPESLQVPFPLDENEDPARKAQVLVAWVGPWIGDSHQVLVGKVLEQVLLGNAASPLRKALLESGLGSALADGTGYHTDYRQSVFAAGLKDFALADAGKVEALILDTLRGLADGGVDEEQVEAAIHGLELSSREVSNAGFPYGLKVLFGDTLYPALHGGDPYRSLQFDQDLQRLQDERKNGHPMEDFIRRVLLGNNHRATVTLEPDQQLAARQVEEERARVDAIAATLSDADRQRLVREAAQLKADQDNPGDPNVLPTLQLSDVPTTFEEVPVRVS